MKNIPTFEDFIYESINEAEKFKATKDFEEFLEEIDGMPEVRIKRIMGNKYIDTPGGYRDEADDYDNDIVEYMISNMGRKEFEKLQTYWETNIKESVNEGTKYAVKDFPIDSLITLKDGEIWKVVKAGMRASDSRVKSDEITIKPDNKLAKDRNVSLAIDVNLDYLNANVKKIEKK